jgi:hypothetical protein
MDAITISELVGVVAFGAVGAYRKARHDEALRQRRRRRR